MKIESKSYFRTAGSPRRVALELAMMFAAAGCVWLIATDVVLFAITDDRVLQSRAETSLDWLFVVLGAAMLYVLAHRAAVRRNRTATLLTNIFASIGDGLILVGPDRTIVHVNPAALRILGCNSEAELVGMTSQQLSRRFLVTLPSGVRVMPDAFAAERAFEEDGVIRHKIVVRATPEREVVLLTTASAVRPRPGAPASVVINTLHDVTDTEHLERMRDRFLAASAHALKTPVAIIKANVQLGLKNAPEVNRASSLAVVRQCDRIDRLVQNLQVVSRARFRNLQLHVGDCELAPIVRETARELAPLSRDLRTEISAMPHVYGDRERLLIAVRNLALEALMAAKPQTPVTLNLGVTGSVAEIDVQYEPLPVAERTFAGSEEYDDSTLGRTATATIVEAHGGQLGDEDLGPQGARLWVHLPTMEKSDDATERRVDR